MPSLLSIRSGRGIVSLLLALVVLTLLVLSYQSVQSRDGSKPLRLSFGTTEPEKTLDDILPDVEVPDSLKSASIAPHIVSSLAHEQAAARPTGWRYEDVHDRPGQSRPVDQTEDQPSQDESGSATSTTTVTTGSSSSLSSSLSSSSDLSTSTSTSSNASQTTSAVNIDVIPDEEHSADSFASPDNRLNYTTTLVLGRLDKDAFGVQWIHDYLKDLTSKMIYIVDDPDAPLHLEKNKGRESIVYIKYILEHYDSLEDVTLFFHDSRMAWHNNMLFNKDSAIMINNLQRDYVVQQGYFPARCELYPGCDPDQRWVKFNADTEETSKHPERIADLFNTELWDRLFPNRTHDPTYLAEPCCSQFAASREAIRSVPRETWQRIYDWLYDTPLFDGYSGRIMENVWQYLFLNRDAYCPSMRECYCKGYGVCLADDTELVQYNAVRKEIDDLLTVTIADEAERHCDSRATVVERLACKDENPAYSQLIDAYLERDRLEAELPGKIGITSP